MYTYLIKYGNWILFLDVDPPIFTFCPKSIKVNTVREAEIIHWSKPEVKDNIGVAYVNGSHTPGSLFPPGKHVVNYTATDRAWNKAYCSFTVIVSEGSQFFCVLCQ